MPFSNSIYKAYLDLATYGPMESAMYERFTPVGEEENKEKSNKSSKFLKILLFLLIIFMIVYLFFS